jgi:hypothetical protein
MQNCRFDFFLNFLVLHCPQCVGGYFSWLADDRGILSCGGGPSVGLEGIFFELDAFSGRLFSSFKYESQFVMRFYQPSITSAFTECIRSAIASALFAQRSAPAKQFPMPVDFRDTQ